MSILFALEVPVDHSSPRSVQEVNRSLHPGSHPGEGKEGDARRQGRARGWSVAARLVLFALALALPISAPASTPLPMLEMTTDPPLAMSNGCPRFATLLKGQIRIEQNRFEEAIAIFTCVINANPLAIDGYRGRAEAKLMLGKFSDAFQDYTRLNAVVVPVHPDAFEIILDRYESRLARFPNSRSARTGAAFAKWVTFDYEGALPHLDSLLASDSTNVFANVFRGSVRLFIGEDVSGGEEDLENAIQLAPQSADVQFIVADAYTYAYPDQQIAFAAATQALQWGLDTPRVNAILASWNFAMGNVAAGSQNIRRHIDLVTTETVAEIPLGNGGEALLDFVAWRTYDIPIATTAGQTVSIRTSSPDDTIFDSIMVLVDSNGTPVYGNDDFTDFYAGFDWEAPDTATYHLLVATFEGASTGQLLVTRNVSSTAP